VKGDAKIIYKEHEMRTWNAILWAVLIVCLLAAACGCSGVMMNAEYSTLLDQTTAWSSTAAAQADANTLDANDLKTVIRTEAKLWAKFRNARDGVK